MLSASVKSAAYLNRNNYTISWLLEKFFWTTNTYWFWIQTLTCSVKYELGLWMLTSHKVLGPGYILQEWLKWVTDVQYKTKRLPFIILNLLGHFSVFLSIYYERSSMDSRDASDEDLTDVSLIRCWLQAIINYSVYLYHCSWSKAKQN